MPPCQAKRGTCFDPDGGGKLGKVCGVRTAAILVSAFAILLTAGSARAVSLPPAALARQGLELLMDGQPDAAIKVFHSVERNDSQSPLGYLLEADAVWWKIYYSTGDLVDPDVFDVVSADRTPWDSHFRDLVNIAIAKSNAHIDARQDLANSYLYLGMAYALRGRLSGLRGRVFATARAAKIMRHNLLLALQNDPKLADADLGLGLYNYFVGALPGIVKPLRWLIGLPGGNCALGLSELETAARDGDLTRAEAQFYLAKDYSRKDESHLHKSLTGFAALAREYPDNGLWKLLEGSVAIRLGQTAEGEALYRDVWKASSRAQSTVQRQLGQAALTALERRHPGEKIE